MKYNWIIALSLITLAVNTTQAQPTNKQTPVVRGEWFLISPADAPFFVPNKNTDKDIIRRPQYYKRIMTLFATRNPVKDAQAFIARNQYPLLMTGALVGRSADPVTRKLKQSITVPDYVYKQKCPAKLPQGFAKADISSPGDYIASVHNYSIMFNRTVLAACIKKYNLDKPLK